MKKKKNINENLYRLIREMVVSEMEDMDFARTAGTGGAYTITPEGETVLKQVKATGNVPMGMTASKIAVLAFLYKAKQEGKRVQKIDYANSIGVLQPQVNKIFNELELEGLITKENYTPKTLPGGGSSRPGLDLDAILGDLDI
jgi:crotonobetainyl-CoA:carnitine CoA-transferase CaiB-like acyl-CoA transferase